MSPREAIADCRRAYPVRGASWPAPLLRYLNTPPNEARVIDWLSLCVEELLERYGEATVELMDALSFARRQTVEGLDLELIEQRAWGLWVRREAEGGPFTAVAQLLFSLSRAGRSQPSVHRVICWAAPICILEKLELWPGEVLDRVIANFCRYVARERLSGIVKSCVQDESDRGDGPGECHPEDAEGHPNLA
jgi:hypothetical protein